MDENIIQQEITLEKKKSTYKPVTLQAVIVGIIGIISASSIGPFFNIYQTKTTALKNCWRAGGNSLYFIPITWYILTKKSEKIDFKKIMTVNTMVLVALSSIVGGLATQLYISSSKYTLTFHSVVLVNLAGVFVILLNLILGKKIHSLELVGTVVVGGMVALLMQDSHSQKAGANTNILWGDLVAIGAAPMFALWYIINSKITSQMPALLLCHLVNIGMSVVYASIHWYTARPALVDFLSLDPEVGVFGWLSSEYLILSLFLIIPIAGVLGGGSYIYLLDYFTPTVIGNIFLLEPFLSQMLSCLLGQDLPPSPMTYLGGIGILIGLFIIVQGNSKTEQAYQEDAEKVELSLIHQISKDSLI